MVPNTENKLIRVGVFYDGNYFAHVSNYYNYEHERRARLSISGIHEFVRQEIAKHEATDIRNVQVVDAHYFRGRMTSYEAEERNKLLSERIFDDILMNEGVVTHYLPLVSRDGKREEKGIDVWLALEAFELALYKRFNVLVLIACDGDYVPLVRKLNTLGTRVMVLGWDFEFTDERTGRLRKTTTSLDLLREVTYPISMQELIDNKIKKNEAIINNLFVPKETARPPRPKEEVGGYRIRTVDEEDHISTIKALKVGGYGFIHYPPDNLYFHSSNIIGCKFNDLREGDEVIFKIGKNERGQDTAVEVRRYLGEEHSLPLVDGGHDDMDM